MSADIDKIKTKCKQLQDAINMMEKEFVECMENAELKNDLSFVIKGNGLKRSSDKTKEDLLLLEKEVLVLEEKKYIVLVYTCCKIFLS